MNIDWGWNHFAGQRVADELAGTSHGDFIYKDAGPYVATEECAFLCIFEFDVGCVFSVARAGKCLLGDYTVNQPVVDVTFTGTERMFTKCKQAKTFSSYYFLA